MSVMPVPKTNVISMIKHDVYPRNEESVRNIRLWDATEKKHLAHRCYSSKRNAHIGALIEARWAAVGTTIEVYDCHNGRLLGQYTRRVNTVSFMGGDNIKADD